MAQWINCIFRETPFIHFRKIIPSKNQNQKWYSEQVFYDIRKKFEAGITLIFAKYEFNSLSYSSYACLAIQICPRNGSRKLQEIGFHFNFSNQLVDV